MAPRTLLTLSILSSLSAVPLIIALVVSVLYIALLGFFQPYSNSNRRVFFIALCANVVVVFMMLAGVVIKLQRGVGTAAGDDALGVVLACLLLAVPALVLAQARAELRSAAGSEGSEAGKSGRPGAARRGAAAWGRRPRCRRRRLPQ